MKKKNKTIRMVGFLAISIFGLLSIGCSSFLPTPPSARAGEKLVNPKSLIANSDGSISQKQVLATGYFEAVAFGEKMRFKHYRHDIWSDTRSPKGYYKMTADNNGVYTIAPVAKPETRVRFVKITEATRIASDGSAITKKAATTIKPSSKNSTKPKTVVVTPEPESTKKTKTVVVVAPSKPVKVEKEVEIIVPAFPPVAEEDEIDVDIFRN